MTDILVGVDRLNSKHHWNKHTKSHISLDEDFPLWQVQELVLLCCGNEPGQFTLSYFYVLLSKQINWH